MANKYTVVVDTREKPNYRWWFEQDEFCSGSELYKLDTGDYSIKGLENTVSLERKKNTSEIAQNIIDPRFFDELERLRSFKYKAIICEFNMFNVMNFPYSSGIPSNKLKDIKITSQFILSKITEIQIRYGVPFIFCDNKDYAITYVKALFKKISAIEKPVV